MSEKSPHKPPKFQEHHTSPRFSLAHANIGSVDVYHNHPSGQVRLLKYDSKRRDIRTVRAAMVWMNLIAGTQLTENDEKEQVFRLPKSARPVGYEASVRDRGEFTYSDEKLIIDLGVILGDVFRIQEKRKRLVVSGDLGRLAVITEFTEPGEPQLFLVPGIEKMMVSLPDDINPAHHYAGNPILSGKKFEQGYELFEQVFNMRINEG